MLIIVPNNAFQMDPDNFPNPYVFDPERFSAESAKDINPVTYMPFGMGSRNCIAGDFGKVLVKITLLEMIKNFEFSAGKRTKVPLEYQPLELRMPLQNIYLNVRCLK